MKKLFVVDGCSDARDEWSGVNPTIVVSASGDENFVHVGLLR
ncbi:MAG: hypothetical protein ABIJ85_01970 [bacterium]